MDLYVLSSTREGLPNTVLEAMAMEVPIVSTDVDGVREAVRDEIDAVLVPALDSDRLAEGIARVLDDTPLRESLVRNARARVEGEFSFAQRTRRIEDVYRRMMESESAGLDSSRLTGVCAGVR
jgi:glycosyltransferase involved in cell wall biosynthesis